MNPVRSFNWKLCACALPLLLVSGPAWGQIAASAYRTLGQANQVNNGLNMVQGLELNSPNGLALDSRTAQVHLYIADTLNARVLAWRDAAAYQMGNLPDLVIGQTGSQGASPYGIGAQGFNQPVSVAVDPTKGDIFVADLGNNRVLRYASPFDNPGPYQPNAVYGQATFTTFSAAAASATSLNQPRAVAVDGSGNLWVADTGNNRVLRFGAAILSNPAPVAADTVIGQKNLTSGPSNQGSAVSAAGFDTPAGLALDSQNNLYVADFNNTRVLKFSGPLGTGTANPTASAVWGESNFTSRGAAQPATNSSLAGPQGIAVDIQGNLYVAVPLDNRVLIFPTAGVTTGVPGSRVFGQANFTTTTANTGALPQASASSLSGPAGVAVDPSGNVFVADTANHRVLKMAGGMEPASQVWGQSDFVSNGPNQIKPNSIRSAYGMAIDYSQSPFALYVSDTANNRVLVWLNSVTFQSGAPADMVIGQPGFTTAIPNIDSGVLTKPTATSLYSPTGIVVDQNGTLFVADQGNNRVLRFPRPIAQQGRITADAVIGQASFTVATSSLASAASLNAPNGLSIGPNGDLFVADTGNNRVLEFPPSPGTGAVAMRVYGQPSLTSSAKPFQPSVQTLSAPQGVFADPASNLFVADTGANRVVVFSNTQTAASSGAAATYVIGQGNFNGGAGGTALNAPVGVGVDGKGQIYIGDAGNNRVLIFPSLIVLAASGAVATGVVGQANLTSVAANWDGQNGSASADSLAKPLGLYVDRQGTIYVGDTGNSRVLQFLRLGAVENAASFQVGASVAPGSIAAIFGSGLATTTGLAASNSWSTTLANRQVVLNDQVQSPVYYVGLNQINFQMPSNIPAGLNRLAVRLADTGELVAGGSLVVAAAAPGLFTNSQGGTGQAAALNQDYSVNSPANPAARGTVIQLYGTGQGLVSPTVPDGTAAAVQPLSYTVAVPTADATACLNNQPSVCVEFGTTGLGIVQYSGLAPGYIGLWQVNAFIPAGTPVGNVQVKVVIDAASSNIVTIAVK